MAGQVFAIASGKGGVGKTTTVVNLGVVLRRADHSVALVDADLGMANLGPMLGVDGERTLHDVLAGESTVEDALVEEAPGFAVLPGSEALADYPDADPRHLDAVLEILAESYDFVLVDTGAGMSHEDVLPLGLADRVVLVASPDPAAIGDTRKTAELAGLADGAVAGLVVTKADADTDATHVASQVGVHLLGVIPYDPTVRESTASGRPLEAIDPESPAAAAYRELANALADGLVDPLTGPQAPDAEGNDAPAEPTATGGQTPDAAEPPNAGSPVDAGEPEDGGSADATETPEELVTADADEEPSAPTTAPETSVQADESPAESAEAGSDATPDETAPSADDPDDEAEVDAEEPGVASGDEPDQDEEAETEPSEDEATEPADEAEAEAVEDDEPATDEAEDEDYLAEFEDDEPESKGGLLSRIGRLFR